MNSGTPMEMPPVSITKALEALGMLTQNDIASFLVFKKAPPKPIEILCTEGKRHGAYIGNELCRLLQLGASLHDKDALKVICMTYVLCKINTQECIPGILRMMDYSTYCIFRLYSGQGTQLLDPFEWVYAECAEALGNMGDRSVIQELIIMVKDSRKNCIRPYACKALGLLRAREACQVLQKALEDTNIDTGPNVREEAAMALELIRNS